MVDGLWSMGVNNNLSTKSDFVVAVVGRVSFIRRNLWMSHECPGTARGVPSEGKVPRGQDPHRVDLQSWCGQLRRYPRTSHGTPASLSQPPPEACRSLAKSGQPNTSASFTRAPHFLMIADGLVCTHRRWVNDFVIHAGQLGIVHHRKEGRTKESTGFSCYE